MKLIIKKRPKNYISRIDSFIPEAQHFANTKCGKVSQSASEEEKMKWSRVFTDKMNELTIKAGLRIAMK